MQHVIFPKCLAFYRADKIFTSVKTCHFLVSTSEVRYKVKEVEREQDHGSQDPLKHEVQEHSVLEMIVPGDLRNQKLKVICARHESYKKVDQCC